MDVIVSSAVEEICSQGQNGLTLRNLWSRLEPSLSASGLDLSNGVKTAVWTQLLSIPSLQFDAGKVTYDAKDPSIQSFENAERLNVKVMGKEYLRDNFVGLYNVRSASSNMSAHQRRVLERLAIARYALCRLDLAYSAVFICGACICDYEFWCLFMRCYVYVSWDSFMDIYDQTFVVIFRSIH